MGNTKYFKVIIHFRKKICVGIYFQTFNDKSENRNWLLIIRRTVTFYLIYTSFFHENLLYV